MQRVLVFCAHSDDQALGAGGFIANLAKQGAVIRTIICSFGEFSHPHLKPEEIRPSRIVESQDADNILGGQGVMFLGLREGKFIQDFENVREKTERFIDELNPTLILTHSSDDPHPDHRAVHALLMALHAKMRLKAEMFTFDVWNLFNLKKRHNPKLMIDITPVFKKKLDAISVFKSQRVAVTVLLWSVYWRAAYWGLRMGKRYGEVYYKVR